MIFFSDMKISIREWVMQNGMVSLTPCIFKTENLPIK